MRFQNLLTSRWGPILTGAVVGILAPLLVKFGNPGNMGICVACFNRDIAGALGLHRAAAVQYIRPEIIGFVLGSLVAALLFREFKPRGGSSPLVRFLLGMFAMIGALVFLGCPWRAYLRLTGGDWNAIPALLGLFLGIGIGTFFLTRGFSLGRARPTSAAAGWIMPIFIVVLLLALIMAPQFGRDANGDPTGPIFFSTEGPGAQHAPLLLALGAGLLIGYLAQRSRFCTVGAFRDMILLRDAHLFNGIIALLVAAFLTNLVLGQFDPGFEGQPVAHTYALWNFGGMVLAGLAFTMAGGCPGRQVFLSGEGDSDAAVFVLGMIVGAGVSHTYNLASSPSGPGPYGPAAVISGLVILVVFGLTMRERNV
jgi:YedE family putative selenium metabolism protein